MRIAIDGTRAFLVHRTGIEEYSYQVIKHLRDKLENHQVVLYVRKNQQVDLELPQNWTLKRMWLPRFTSQIRFSLEFLINSFDASFIPAHVVPPIHPKNTIVVVHGLEYEFCPQSYSKWAKFYMRTAIKNSCKWASKIISVSENTKKDLIELYNISSEKIEVVYEGYEIESRIMNNELRENSKFMIHNSKFLLFVGRIEDRKNICNVIEAFEILKEENNVEHKLVLAGNPGYGYEEIKFKIQNSKFKNDIVELGFVSEHNKWQLLKNAEVFVFATKYEGFGIPILEAQSVGCPVVASNNSSIPEVVLSHHFGLDPKSRRELTKNSSEILKQVHNDNPSALLVNPNDSREVAENIGKLLSDKELKNAIIQKGFENVKRFSWDRCAEEIAEMLYLHS